MNEALAKLLIDEFCGSGHLEVYCETVMEQSRFDCVDQMFA